MEPKDAERIFPAYREKLKSESGKLTPEEVRQNNLRWTESENIFGYNVLRLALPLLDQNLSNQMLPLERRKGWWSGKKIEVIGAWAIHSRKSPYETPARSEHHPMQTYVLTQDEHVGWVQEDTYLGVYITTFEFGPLSPNSIHLATSMGPDESIPSHFNGHTIYLKLQDLLATAGIDFHV